MEQPPEPAAAADPGPCTAAPQAHSPAQAAPPPARGPREAAAPAAERRQSRPGAGPSSGAEHAGAAVSPCGEERDGSAGGGVPVSYISRGGPGDWRAGRDARVTHPDRVFVSVAAYRDEEAQWTVADLLRRAARPERVRIGIVWQARARACPERMRVSIVWQARARAHAGGPRGAARALLPEAGHPWARHVLFSWVPSQNSHSACSRRAGMAARMGHCLPARRRRRLLYRCLRALCAPEGACGRGHAEERSRGRQVDEEEDAAFVRVAGSAAERARWAPQARPPPAAAPLVCARLGPARNAHALLVAGSGLLATGAPARDSPATGLPLWRMLCRLLPGDLGSQHFPIIP